jgi:hypothetical protein
MDPQDQAAVLLLRAVLEDLEAGRTYAGLLESAEGERGLFRLTVGVRPRDAAAAPPPAPPGPLERAGAPCAECGARLFQASTSIVCPRCGVRAQLPDV